MKRLAGAWLLALMAATAGAAEHSKTRLWINAGVYALHFDRDEDLRDDNLGAGVELGLALEHAVSAGTYINSNRAGSRYAAHACRPWHWRLAGLDVFGGIVAGAFDGYPNYRNDGWFLAPLPLLAVEGRWFGVNLSVIPDLPDRLDGAIAIQLAAW